MTSTIVKGLTGVTLLEITDQIPSTENLDLLKIILQIIVSIGTLISIIRKSKDKNTTP